MDPFEDLPVGLHHTTEILSETIFVQDPILFILTAAVPKPEGVWAALIRQQQSAVGRQPEFELEIHKLEVDLGEERQQQIIHPPGQLFNR